ncbi:MAG: leucine-rich repeat domain-containing protein [Chitinispirillaceae bacterium]|nr:leucine-rich repeat domain-containing protein [Chitinispirillaceae bacterium]
MAKYLLIAIILACGIAAQDITVSKDSLKIYNNHVSSFADGIVFTSIASAATALDSAFVVIDDMDTTGSTRYVTDDRLQARWRENLGTSIYFYWDLTRKGANEYRMTLQSSSPADTQPLLFSMQDEQRGIAMLEIGGCLGCSGLPTWYPPYFKGTLALYFSNGQTISLRLYSEDLRKPVQYGEPCVDYACDTMNVRKILDRNGLESVSVKEVTNSGNRVTSLQLVYNPAGEVSLPKPCTVIPDEIGNLTALSSIMAVGNAFDSISSRIGCCSRLITIFANNNGIAALPDSIVNCISLRTISLDNNQLTRLPDSMGKLKSLSSFSIAGNLLTSLPASMAELDSVNCLFIAGNRICTLPEAVIAWMTDVQTNTFCARWEPVWPDSQRCDSVAAERIPALERPSAYTAKRIARKGGFITMELGNAGGTVRRIEIFDLSGKRVEAIVPSVERHSPNTVRLNASRYPAGRYYMRIISGTSNETGCSFVIER